MLKDLLHDTNTARLASVALGSLGTEGVPSLREALANPNPEIRMAAMNAPYFRRNIGPLMLDDILRMTNDPDPRITRSALVQIGAFAPVERSLPILTNYLYNPRLRNSALSGLRRMGTNARSATPHLLAFYTQEKPNIKALVLPVLQRTDPAAAARISSTNINAVGTRKH